MDESPPGKSIVPEIIEFPFSITFADMDFDVCFGFITHRISRHNL